MSAHMIRRDFDDSQLAAERRAARLRLCAATPRDSREAGIGGWPDGRAQSRVDWYLAGMVVIALPILLAQLLERI